MRNWLNQKDCEFALKNIAALRAELVRSKELFSEDKTCSKEFLQDVISAQQDMVLLLESIENSIVNNTFEGIDSNIQLLERLVVDSCACHHDNIFVIDGLVSKLSDFELSKT